MMNGLLKNVKKVTPYKTKHLKRNWFITHARRSGNITVRRFIITSFTRRMWRTDTATVCSVHKGCERFR